MKHYHIVVFIFIAGTSAHAMEQHSLSLAEKIGQLIIAPIVASEEKQAQFMAHSSYRMDHEHVRELIREGHVGGLLFLGNGATRYDQKKTTEEMQHYNQEHNPDSLPLLICMDAEWGLCQRLSDTTNFPRPATLGKLRHGAELIYELGLHIAQQCRSIGVHLNFSPVADVNTNPDNPVIGTRSFGSDPNEVARRTILFMQGMQAGGILTCAKHFPGHGDTTVDSHKELPRVEHPRERLKAIELKPFRRLIKAGVDAVMPGHLCVPALDAGGAPASLSKAMITDLLRNQYWFSGVVVTDGLGMSALTDNYTHDEIVRQAINAGNDLLLCPVDTMGAVQVLMQMVQEGELSEDDLDQRVARIVCLKHRAMSRESSLIKKPRIADQEKLVLRLYEAEIAAARERIIDCYPH